MHLKKFYLFLLLLSPLSVQSLEPSFSDLVVEELRPLAATLSTAQKAQLTKVLTLFQKQLDKLDSLSTDLSKQVESLNLQLTISKSLVTSLQEQLQISKELSMKLEKDLTKLSTSLNDERVERDWQLLAWSFGAFMGGWGVGLVLHF